MSNIFYATWGWMENNDKVMLAICVIAIIVLFAII